MLLLAAHMSFAQAVSDTSAVKSWVYCEIVGSTKLFSTKVDVSVDYGQARKFFSDQRIRDEEGKIKTFNSMVDAMNYLGEQGWEFVQAYVVTIGNQNVYHWLLKADAKSPIFIPSTKKLSDMTVPPSGGN